MRIARIFRPTKSATQSGRARTHEWRLAYAPDDPISIDPLMGWASSSDMDSQIHLTFLSRDEAIAYAEKNGITYHVEEPAPEKPRIISYSDNFRAGRLVPWTH